MRICSPLWPVLVLAGTAVLESRAQPTGSQQCPADIELCVSSVQPGAAPLQRCSSCFCCSLPAPSNTDTQCAVHMGPEAPASQARLESRVQCCTREVRPIYLSTVGAQNLDANEGTIYNSCGIIRQGEVLSLNISTHLGLVWNSLSEMPGNAAVVEFVPPRPRIFNAKFLTELLMRPHHTAHARKPRIINNGFTSPTPTQRQHMCGMWLSDCHHEALSSGLRGFLSLRLGLCRVGWRKPLGLGLTSCLMNRNTVLVFRILGLLAANHGVKEIKH